MTKAGGNIPAAVPERAIRAGAIPEALLPHQEWSWVEPRVWTARMLAALPAGVKGGKSNAFFAEHGFSACVMPMSWPASPLAGEPSTGEPDAGDLHVRLGGRGCRTQSPLPTPIIPAIGTGRSLSSGRPKAGPGGRCGF
jgi:hypothetical protein